AFDLHPFLDEHAADLSSVRAGLVGDECHPDHLLGDALGFVRRFRELDAASLAATAGVNLRLDDDHGAAETFGNRGRFSGIENDFAARNGNTESGENGLGLVLVNLQMVRDSWEWETHPCYSEPRKSVNAANRSAVGFTHIFCLCSGGM